MEDNKKTKIYCVEDDESIRELIVYTLKSYQFDALGLESGDQLMDALKTDLPDLILLDVMLPGQDGFELLKQIRSNPAWSQIPVIMETARGTEFDKVKGLDSGADDYLAKPFGMIEMVSRIKAVLRRSAPKAEKVPVLKAGEIEINPHEHQVFVHGKAVDLTLKEYELLKLLMENNRIVLSRETLLDKVWQSSAALETRTVDVHINTLRSKLSDCKDYIQTVRGVGYRFCETK